MKFIISTFILFIMLSNLICNINSNKAELEKKIEQIINKNDLNSLENLFLNKFPNLKKEKKSIDNDQYQDLRDIARKINETVTTDPYYKYAGWEKTAYIVDTFGPRMWGQPALEAAIQKMYDVMKKDGFENVKLEQIDNVPVWIRGTERLTLRSPRKYPFEVPMIGLGLSVSGNLVDTEVIVLNTIEDMAKHDLTGKIVMLNGKWDKNYGNTVKYRSQGASKAAEQGAVGIIIRSIAPKSYENPHTGRVDYTEGIPKIPGAAISLEDADMFQRMSDRGQKITVDLYMEGHFQTQMSTTYNIVGELIGSTHPEEILLLGGHIDSWDTGSQTGANDDLSGFYACYEAVRVLKDLGFRPKRTLRVIGWSGEEQGFPNKGAFEYAKKHLDEIPNHVLAFESDEGVTKLQGFGLNSSEKAYSMVYYLTYMLKDSAVFDYNSIFHGFGEMVDTKPLYALGVPQMNNVVADGVRGEEYDTDYFNWHHSAADTMNIIDKDGMDSNVIGIAQIMYAIANLPNKLPRD